MRRQNTGKPSMPQVSREILRQQFKITNYIGLAMIGSIFIYAFLVLALDKGYFSFLDGGEKTINAAVLTKIKYLFILLSVAIFLILKFKGNSILIFFQKQYAKSLYPTVLALFAFTLLVFALCEVIGIYGLVLFILSRNATDFFIFMAISLLYFYLLYPKYAEWERFSNQDSLTSKSR